jgi:hypothetical protein
MPRVADVARQVAVFLLPAIVSLYCDLGFLAGLRSGFSVCDSDFKSDTATSRSVPTCTSFLTYPVVFFFLNALNHTNFATPTIDNLTPFNNDGTPNTAPPGGSGYGAITATQTPNRQIQFAIESRSRKVTKRA